MQSFIHGLMFLHFLFFGSRLPVLILYIVFANYIVAKFNFPACFILPLLKELRHSLLPLIYTTKATHTNIANDAERKRCKFYMRKALIIIISCRTDLGPGLLIERLNNWKRQKISELKLDF